MYHKNATSQNCKIVFALLILSICLLFAPSEGREVQAKVETRDVTPKEKAGSDLKILKTVTKLASRRWIQSFTKDSKYYYYIQMTNPYKGHLRITRVKYKGFGKYRKDFMTLKGFGHGTNLDCSIYNGKTYLWTGSDGVGGSVTTSISCFRYKRNSILRRHSSICYKIPREDSGKYASNVFPAINQNGRKLAVRYTYDGKQYYQIYQLTEGTIIDVTQPQKVIILSATKGDFQGFDIRGTTIYTIEGSPRKSFLKSYDPSRKYQPTAICTSDYVAQRQTRQVIKGAKRLSFREPEGVKAISKKRIEILYVSNTLTNQSCNIYQLKKAPQ